MDVATFRLITWLALVLACRGWLVLRQLPVWLAPEFRIPSALPSVPAIRGTRG